MVQAAKLMLCTLLGILGWHGVFLLFLIIVFKLFLLEEGNYACPCDWSLAYGTIMFLFPSFISYVIAFFAYFRQDDESVPWKVLKKFYEYKFACHRYKEQTIWELHAECCIRCKQLKRDWDLVKIAVSAVFSFLYPFVWLSLSFLQTYFYVCVQVGADRVALENYCNVSVPRPDEYDQKHGSAIISSKAIGSVMFVITLFSVGLLVILYGEIENYLLKKCDWSPHAKNGPNLEVQISVLAGHSYGSITSASSYSNRDSPVARTLEAAAETAKLVPYQPPVLDGGKAISINLSNTFAETLHGCLQDNAWQRIGIRCSEQEEDRSRKGSYAPFRPPSAARVHEQRTGEHTYESLLCHCESGD